MSTCHRFLVGLVVIIRFVLSVQGQPYIRCEVHLAKALAGQMEEKCQLIKLNAAKEKCRGIESSFDNARYEKESLNIPSFADTCRKVTTTYWALKQEITSLVHKLKGERSKCFRQEEETVETLKTLRSPEKAVKISTSRAAVPNPPGWPPPLGWTWVLSTKASPAASCAASLRLHLRIPETSGASLGCMPPPPHAVHSAQLLQEDPSTCKEHKTCCTLQERRATL